MTGVADSSERWRATAEAAGQAVIERRVELGYRTRAQFADDIELTTKTLGQVERGERPSYDRSTYVTLDQSLDWAPGTFEALLKGEDPPLRKPVDLESEFATLAGLVANLHRLDAQILAALLHRSGLPFEAVYDLVMAERAAAVGQLRTNWQRLAEQIRQRGGTVDVGTWPPWLEAPPIVEEIRRGEDGSGR